MRQFGSHLAVLLAGLVLGVGAVAMANRGPTASSSADVASAVRSVGYKLDAIKRDLDTTNRKLDVTNGSLAGFTTITPSRTGGA